jgi:uncharacterized protein (UPF0147 family)
MANINEVLELLGELSNDRRVPRNVRASIDKAIEHLNNKEDDETVRLSSAISILDEICNDPNILQYTRTQVWNVVSLLESLQTE